MAKPMIIPRRIKFINKKTSETVNALFFNDINKRKYQSLFFTDYPQPFVLFQSEKGTFSLMEKEKFFKDFDIDDNSESIPNLI